MRRPKTAAIIFAAVTVCGVAVFWPARQETTKPSESVQAQDRVRAGQGDAEAQYRLGAAYYYGNGVARDYVQAVRWFQKSAANGNAKAQYFLGYLYRHGQGVKQDFAAAARWMRGAAERGYARAQCELGYFYYQGTGVSRNVSESLAWYKRCAAQGNSAGQRWLGYQYERGREVPREPAEAVRWYRKAAEQGDLTAALYLARAYRTGKGAPRSYVKAARWYLKIAEIFAVNILRRMGWIPFAALGLLICAVAVPERRWGRARWLSWASMALGCAAYAFHLVSGAACRGTWRIFGIGALGTLAAISIVAAVYEWRHRADVAAAWRWSHPD
jgi:TPR repeat protein